MPTPAVYKGDKRIYLPELKKAADYLMIGHEDECPEDCDHEKTLRCDPCRFKPRNCPHADNCPDLDEHDEANEMLACYQEALSYAGDGAQATLISDDDFEEYAREVADDIYGIPDHWPYTCIDWEEAADDLKADYTSVMWGDTEYWVRS